MVFIHRALFSRKPNRNGNCHYVRDGRSRSPTARLLSCVTFLKKIVAWIHRFKETGDTLVQYDPGHAALPWAAVRFLLQMAISEVQVFEAMAEERECNIHSSKTDSFLDEC